MTDSSITNYDNYIFTQNLNLNLKQQKHNALLIEKYVNKNFISLNNKQNNNNEVWALGNYTQYNYLLYPLKDMSKLYYSIKDMFYSSLQNSKYDEYSIQCWLNIFNKGSYIDWHSHWPAKWESWHGFYCVEVEPDSFTSYKIKDGKISSIPFDSEEVQNVLSSETENTGFQESAVNLVYNAKNLPSDIDKNSFINILNNTPYSQRLGTVRNVSAVILVNPQAEASSGNKPIFTIHQSILNHCNKNTIVNPSFY